MNEGGNVEEKLSFFQKKCLTSFKRGENVLIIAPSSSGKTFIVERYIKDFFKKNYGKFLRSPRKLKIAFVLPYKALAVQEFNQLSLLLEHKGIKLLLAVGGVEVKEEELIESNLIIGTYEKFLLLFKRYETLKNNLQLLIIDEFHFLGTERGRTIEELIIEWKKKEFQPQLILLSSSIS
ncbi:MAG: DEAD/DEAH box helicase, partial [Candidatus Heimdallarchaeaceae archaeon]